MSLIASFYLLPEARLPALLEAAPRPRGWFRARRDDFPEFLQAQASKLGTFAYSGGAFGTLDEYLRQKGATIFTATPEAKALSAARGSTWAVYDAPKVVLDDLSLCDPDEMEAFVVITTFGQWGTEGLLAALPAAVDTLAGWLRQVQEGTVGLLHIG